MKSSKPFIERYFKNLPGPIFLLLLLFVGSVFLFGFITHEVLWQKEEDLDHSIFNFLSSRVITSQLTPVMKTITYFASGTFLKIAYGIVILSYLIQKNWKRALEIAVIGVGGYLINYFMKLSFERLRPADPLIEPLHNFSFPSGHATAGFIFYGLLVYLIWKTKMTKSFKYFTGALLVVFAGLIAFSRVYLRLHYATDVIAGFCIGFAWLTLCVWLMERLKKQSSKELKQNKS